MTETAAVEFEGVSKAFGDESVLDAVDFAVHPGECLAIVGPSGIGKSTLLRIAAGLEAPDQGSVRIHGETGVPARKRGVGMLFQDLALWPHMTARRQLEFVLAPSVRGRGERRAEAMAWIERVGLDAAKASARPHALSGGQRQRLALARALAPRPRILLLDEPFNNLDDANCDRVAALIAEQRDAGAALLVATHDANDLRGLADESLSLLR